MDYGQAMDFLEETKKYGSRLGLASIRTLLSLLGDPQDRVPVVHLAGTNGKGSVGAMLSSVMTQAGYRAGHFSTPDVFSYEEEFMINGEPVSRERLARLFTTVAACCGKMQERGCPHPTRFEVETAAAFLLFFEEKCEIAVVEAGMGGETDATNVVKRPLLSILTSISMDHMDFLGDTLAEIAAVKSGIIKESCPVVTVRQDDAAMAVIREKCEQMHAPCLCADAGQFVRRVRSGSDGISGEFFRRDTGEWQTEKVGLRGLFQAENALCAIEAARLLREKYPAVTEEAIRNGLAGVQWRGRFEQIGSAPDFYLDGAHNEDAVKKLRETLDFCFTDRRILYIMGVLADKDYRRMGEIMFRASDRVYTVTPKNPRALDARTLAAELSRLKADASACGDAAAAVEGALREAKAEDVILAFGSLSYLADVREAYNRRKDGLVRETGK